jgi:hypothetical protein
MRGFVVLVQTAGEEKLGFMSAVKMQNGNTVGCKNSIDNLYFVSGFYFERKKCT